MKSVRWGILGGIFDPIHYAHLAIAEQGAEALDLAGVLFMPAGRPVHRAPPRASTAHRVRMVELAIADNAAFAVSRLEAEADRPSFSVDALETLAGERPGVGFVLIVSAEAAAYLPEWSRPERLLELAEIAIVPRLGHPDISREWVQDHFAGQAERFSFVETSRLGHSSTDVRARRAAGLSIRYLVPPAVESYISEHDLYGPDDRPPA